MMSKRRSLRLNCVYLASLNGSKLGAFTVQYSTANDPLPRHKWSLNRKWSQKKTANDPVKSRRLEWILESWSAPDHALSPFSQKINNFTKNCSDISEIAQSVKSCSKRKMLLEIREVPKKLPSNLWKAPTCGTIPWQPEIQPPSGWLSWESAGLLSGRSRVQTTAGPTLRVFKKLRRKCCLCNDICERLDFLVFSKNRRSRLTALTLISCSCGT